MIKDVVEKAAIKLGRLLRIRPPKEELMILKEEFGYIGYAQKHHDHDYDIIKYRTYDYAEEFVTRAMDAARTTGILLAFTTLLQQAKDASSYENASFDFFKHKFDVKLSKYNGLYKIYQQGVIDVIDRIKEIKEQRS